MLLAWIILGIACGVGLYDLGLWVAGAPTVSKQVQDFTSRWVDVVITIGLGIFVWYIGGVVAFDLVLIGYLIRHFFGEGR